METVTKKTPLVLVTGVGAAVRAAELAAPGTVVLHHDLTGVAEGLVVRTETTWLGDRPDQRISVVALAHGCVSCTLREDLLPLLRTMHRRSGVTRIVLALDPVLEAESVCDAIDHVAVDMVGEVCGPAGRDVEVVAVIGIIDAATWLDDALGEEEVGERYPTSSDDDRTLAQLALAQVAYADAVVVAGDAPDPARLRAVVRRLAPGVPI
ncbi:GTP-binding protein, partial [Tsukamurella soli]